MLRSDAGVRLALATALAFCSTVPALSHGIVGNRFFPATITTDDPFAADELSLPTVSYQNTGIDPSVKETDINGEFSKRITPDIGFSFATGWTHLGQQGPPRNPSGWQNIELGLRWQFLTNAPHEAVASVALNTELGGPGARRIGADPFTTYTPTFLFGKGAGDLPETLEWFRPLALTGTVGYAIPSMKKTRSYDTDLDTGETAIDIEHHSNQVVYGFAVEYSMLYLRSQVRDLGFPEWVNRLDASGRVQFFVPDHGPFRRADPRHDQPGHYLVGPADPIGDRGDHPGNPRDRQKCRCHRPGAFLSR